MSHSMTWQQRLPMVAAAAAIVNLAWIIASCSIVPMVDLPIWMHQGWLLAQWIGGHLAPQYIPIHAPVPNSTSTLMIGLLSLAFGIDAAGKIAIVITIVIFAAGSWYLVGALGAPRSHPVYYLPLILIPTHFFFSGELSYLVGLGLTCLFLGHLLRWKSNLEALNIWLLAALAWASYLSSFTAILSAGLIALILVIGVRDRRLLRAVTIAFLPPLVMLVWYTLVRIQSGEVSAHSFGWWSSVGMLAGSYVDVLGPFQGFAPWFDAGSRGFRAVALVNLVFTIGVAGLFVWALVLWRFRARTNGIVLLAAICAMLASAAAGRQFTIAMTGERFIFPALFTLCAWLGVAWPIERWRPWAALAACALLIAQGVYLHRVVVPVSRELAATLAHWSEDRSAQDFVWQCEALNAASWPPHRSPMEVFVPNNTVARRIVYYDCIEHAAAVPIWQTGIFHYRGDGTFDDECTWNQCL